MKNDQDYTALVREIACYILWPGPTEVLKSDHYSDETKARIKEWYELPMEERKRLVEKTNLKVGRLHEIPT